MTHLISPSIAIFFMLSSVLLTTSVRCGQLQASNQHAPMAFGTLSGNLFQPELDTISDGILMKSFSFGEPARGIDIIRTSDNGFLICGNVFSPVKEKASVCLLKVDQKGGLLWKEVYEQPERSTYGWSLSEMKYGYMILGFVEDATGTHALLMRFDLEGSLMWQKDFGTVKRQIGWSFLQNREGDFVGVGEWSEDGSKRRIWIFKMDGEGELVWEKFIDPGERTERAFYITEVSDHEYAVCGTTAIREKVDDDVIVVKFNDDGEVLWRRQVNVGAGRDVGHSLKSENGLINVYGYYETPYRYSNPLLLTLDSGGDLQSVDSLAKEGYDVRVMNGVAMDDRQYLIGYARSFASRYNKAILMTVDDNKNITGFREFGSPGMNSGYAIKSDGKLVFGCGAITGEDNPDKSEILFFMKK